MRGKNLFFPLRLISLMLGCQGKFSLGGKQGWRWRGGGGKLLETLKESLMAFHSPALPGVGGEKRTSVIILPISCA